MLSFVRAISAGLAAALLVVVVMYLGLSNIIPRDNPAPTDQALEANFRAHKQNLESLVEMSKLDRNQIIRTPAGQPSFSREQTRQFNYYVREAGVQGDIRHESRPDGTSTTYLPCWNRVLITNSTSKGYAYSETELTPVVTSLDDMNSWPKGSKMVYKKLDGNWYLFHMST